MIAYVAGSLAGRVAAVLCVLVIALPYLLRRNRLSRGLGLAQEHAAPYLRRLWPHVWVGYAILALSTIHAGTVSMRRANQAGIWAATVAFVLLLLEIVVGLSLKGEGLEARRPWRRIHFWTMAGFVAALGAHLWWNG